MPTTTLAGHYTDRHGREALAILNDGHELRTTLRGVDFVAWDFDSLTPVQDTPAERLASFTFSRGMLCDCSLAFDIPVPVVVPGAGEQPGSLHVDLGLGAPASNGGIDREDLRLALSYGGSRVESPGKDSYFEFELLALARQLPPGVFIKACINCALSDYSVYGQGLFGGMLCFRNIAGEYLAVRTKREFAILQHRHEREVQETFLCDRFERRVLGTGYRG